jgi:ParB-like chromosome segregation protein Spo0J
LPWRTAVRLLPASVLAVVAAAIGGLLGVLIGFLAGLILLDRLLDRVLDRAGQGTLEADHAYRRLAHERTRASIERRLRHLPRTSEHLEHLVEDRGELALATRRRLGVVAIPVSLIVGTVDERKAATFDRRFRPPGFSRGRWTLMYRAARDGAQLPPISVYRVGDKHYVRDGHHRVSVARALGADSIDADVVELVDRRRRRAS